MAPQCSDIIGELASRRRLVQNRPELLTALAKVGSDDMLGVSRARSLARTPMMASPSSSTSLTAESPSRSSTASPPENTHCATALDFVHELTRVRHEIQVQQIRAGITAARERGRKHGRPVSIDEEMKRTIWLRHSAGNSIRAIAQEVGVSVGSLHGVLRKA